MADNPYNIDNDPSQLQSQLDSDNANDKESGDFYQQMMKIVNDLSKMNDTSNSLGSSSGGSANKLLAGQDKKAEKHNQSSSPSPEGIDEVANAVAKNPEMLAVL